MWRKMFKFLSKQAVKATLRPFRLSTGTARRIHSTRLPYTSPPSCETVDRRFPSSQVDPQCFFTRKYTEETRDRGEYVGTHDVSSIGPSDYDVFISDIKHETLNTRIAEEVGIPSLPCEGDGRCKKGDSHE